MKRIAVAILLLVLIFGSVFAWKMYMNRMTRQFMADRKPPPVTVAAKEAAASVWNPSLRAVGSLRAVQGVQVTGEIDGQVVEIRFESGKQVEKGDILLLLEDSADVAELKRLRSSRDLARIQFDRMKRLAKRGMAPQSDLDKARAEYREVLALIEKQRVLIEKKKIKAPFAGTLGIRRVDLGQFLPAGTPVVNLQRLQPIYVDFSLPQQNMQQVAPGREVAFSLQTETDSEREFHGTIEAVDPLVEEGSRSFHIRATLDNTSGLLRPGMFGRVRVDLPGRERFVTLPQTAVSYNPYGDVVFILSPGQEKFQGQPLYSASRRFVSTGRTRGDQVAVLKGVREGEMVVISGQHKLREGSRAVVNNDILPANDPSPKLENK